MESLKVGTFLRHSVARLYSFCHFPSIISLSFLLLLLLFFFHNAPKNLLTAKMTYNESSAT